MSRREPRKSSLAGSSPITPPRETPTETQPQPKRPKDRGKVSFYQDRTDTARLRGALVHTQGSEGARSLSDFVHRAAMAEVERLEAKYNDGQPFPSVGTREIPQGRPVGE